MGVNVHALVLHAAVPFCVLAPVIAIDTVAFTPAAVVHVPPSVLTVAFVMKGNVRAVPLTEASVTVGAAVLIVIDCAPLVPMFAAVSAVALGTPELPEWEADAEDVDDHDEADPDASVEDERLVLALAPPPRPGGGALDGMSHPPRREQLRQDNAERARDLARWTGLGHAQVNQELNRLSGVARVSEATSEQLAERLRHADRWLARCTSTLGR